MIALRARRTGKAWARRKTSPGIDVDEEQRRHLIECCAFFRAQRFRESGPGEYRQEDLRAAQAEIDAVIRPSRRKKRR